MAQNSLFRLGDLTAEAFAGVVKEQPVILLPLGSHEDHGSHLPMGDYLLAEMLAVRIARSATSLGTLTFVAPSLPFGVSDYFGSTPGGMAISSANFRGVLEDLLTGLLRHNLSNIVILNGHGGNAPVIHEVTLRIKHERNFSIPSFYLWKVAKSLMESSLGPGHQQRFGHGAEPLLSLSLALRPDATPVGCRDRKIQGHIFGLPVVDFGTVAFEDVRIEAPVEFDQVPRSAGDAALPLASAALGAVVADALVDIAARFVCHFAANAASASGVSKSINTESVSTGISTTDSI
jgi:creatinine amidohydrolase